MANRIQYRRDLAASWTSENPTLASGEPGYEVDTGKMKIGTGSATWTALSYEGGSGATTLLALTDVTGDGTNGQVLTTDGAASFSFTTVGAAIGNDLTDVNSVTSQANTNMELVAQGGTLDLKVDGAAHTSLNKTGDGKKKLTVEYVNQTAPTKSYTGSGTSTQTAIDYADGSVAKFTGSDASIGTISNISDGVRGSIFYPAAGAGNNVINFTAASTNLKFGSAGSPFDGTYGGQANDYNPTPASTLMINWVAMNSNCYVTSWSSTED